jgi:hypothetical protein
MSKTNDNHARQNVVDSVIELGVASVETKGEAGVDEGLGIDMAAGISDE